MTGGQGQVGQAWVHLGDVKPGQGQLQLIANNARGAAVAQSLGPGPVSSDQSSLGSENSGSCVEPGPSPGPLPLPDPAGSDAAKTGYNGSQDK